MKDDCSGFARGNDPTTHNSLATRLPMFAVFRLYFLAWMMVQVGPVSFSARQCWGDSQPRLLPNFPPPGPNAPSSGDFNESIGLEDQGVHAGQTRQERAPVPVLRTQLDVDQESKRFGEAARLWNIMVRSNHPCHLPISIHSPLTLSTHTHNPHPPTLLYFPPPPYSPMPPPYLGPAYVPWLDFTK